MENIWSTADNHQTSSEVKQSSGSEQVIEFTLIRDTLHKVTRIIEWKSAHVEKSFQRDPNIRYHYTTDLSQLSSEELARTFVFSKDTIKTPPEEGNMKRIFEVCGKNKKEIWHNEDIVMSDFSIWDRMEAHVLPRPHISTQVLLTCEYQGQIFSIFVLSGTYDKPVVCPYTTGWHVAVTENIKDVLRTWNNTAEFHAKIFHAIRENMTKEIQEETWLTINLDDITYFQADPNDPTKTYTYLPTNFSKFTKANEEFVHIFHAHLSKDTIDGMIANHEDGIDGFVMSPFLLTSTVLETWKSIPLYKLNWDKYNLHPRNKYSSDGEYEESSNLATIDDMQQEYVRSQPKHIPTVTQLVKSNLAKHSGVNFQ